MEIPNIPRSSSASVPRVSSPTLQHNGRSSLSYGLTEAVTIEIVESSIKAGSLHKHVLYSISVFSPQGQDESTAFDITRRYRDFRALRDFYIEKWPGVFIPPVPGKVIFVLLTQGNTAPNFILLRKKLLEVFLQKVVSVPFLYSSEEFQLFIRGPADFKALMRKRQELTYATIARAFVTTFADFDTITELTPEIEQKIICEKCNLEGIIITTKKLQDYIRRTNECAKAFAVCQARLSTGFESFHSYYSPEISSNMANRTFKAWRKTPEIVAFTKLEDWISIEVSDLTAIIEALERREHISEQKKKFGASLKKCESKLANLNVEKNPKKKAKLDAKVAKLRGNIDSLERILLIASVHLVSFDLPKFRESKMFSYFDILRKYITESTSDSLSALRMFESLISS